MLGVGVLLGLYWAYQWLGTASIEITSEPEGAIVVVNGLQRGLTPSAAIEVDAGEQGVVVKHTHYQPARFGLSLRRGDHEQRHVVLTLGTGTYELLSNPRGAWVEVDGVRLPEVTPTSFQTTSGPHEIRMGLEERHIVAETHTVNHDATETVNLNLNIDPHGSLTVTTKPRGGRVTFLDADLNYTPNMRLRIGEYALRVEKSGYLPQEFRYVVKYGSNLHQVELARGYGHLQVHAQPSNSEISVSYAQGGQTQQVDYTPAMRLPIGDVRIRIRALGRRTVVRTLNLKVEGATLNVTLKPIEVQIGGQIKDALAVGGTAPKMIIVPPGEFMMGDDHGSYSEKPARRVTLTQPFAVSETEVTIGDYLVYLRHTGHAPPPKIDVAQPEVAMAGITYAQAYGYSAWLSEQTGQAYRLPTEAEWEYVTRAGAQTDYSFGDDPLGLCEFGNVADLTVKTRFRDWDVLGCEDGMVRVGLVGQYQANAFGLKDLYGNVSEWVSDCGMPSYSNAPTDGRAIEEGVECPTHGYRGGSWDSSAAEAKSVYRNSASTAADDRGIRLVREL